MNSTIDPTTTTPPALNLTVNTTDRTEVNPVTNLLNLSTNGLDILSSLSGKLMEKICFPKII